jgi:hypothetical protein
MRRSFSQLDEVVSMRLAEDWVFVDLTQNYRILCFRLLGIVLSGVSRCLGGDGRVAFGQ